MRLRTEGCHLVSYFGTFSIWPVNQSHLPFFMSSGIPEAFFTSYFRFFMSDCRTLIQLTFAVIRTDIENDSISTWETVRKPLVDEIRNLSNSGSFEGLTGQAKLAAGSRPRFARP